MKFEVVKPPVEPVKVAEPLVLSLQSEPSGAEVEIGGDKKGLTPLEVRLEVAKLPTLLKVTAEGYESYQQTLSEGTDPTLTVTLKKKAKPMNLGRPPDAIKTTR
jgi:hypothetical protein